MIKVSTCAKHGDAAVGLWWQYVYERVAVFVEGDAGARFEQLPINGR